MSQEPQKVAIPTILRKRLKAFLIRQGKKQHYILVDQVRNETYQFEPWQFFILEILHGCDDFSKLASVFKDRFGQSIKDNELEELLNIIVDNKLFSLAALSHPIFKAFNKKRITQHSQELSEESYYETAGKKINISEKKTSHETQAKPSAAKNTESQNNTATKRTAKLNEGPLPPGIHDAIGLDDTMRNRGWKLFNPSNLLKRIQPLLLPLRHTIYLLPVLFIAAFFVSFRYLYLIEEDLSRLYGAMSFIKHALLSMVTVNLLVTMVTALVAYTYRATVSAFCIVFILGFFPRFMVRIGHVRQLSRRERIWLHSAPLMLRLGLFGFGILLWFNTRAMDDFLHLFGLAIAGASMISFFITVNPLVKSNGYHLLSAFLNEPHLRGKSYMSLMNKFRGNVYKKVDNNVLAAYGLASIVFMIVAFSVLLFLFGRFLKIYFGGVGVLLFGFITLILVLRMIAKFKKIGQVYERSVQFQRWRDRTLPKVKNDTVVSKRQNTFITYLKRATPLFFLGLLFIPYNYEPGGDFVVLPNQQQEITSEISGIIEKIYFDGGEFLKKGTVIGQLSHSDYLAELKICTAKIQEQQAVINDLKSRPRPEEVRLAESALEVEKTRAEFSKGKLRRLNKLYKEGTVSFEELDDAKREYAIDLDQVKEKQANLDLIKLGASPDQIAAAEASLQKWQEELNYFQEKIEESIFYMPFDGKLVTMHLKQKIGSYLNKGDTLAVVENTDQVLAQIDVPESDISYVKENAKVRIRPYVYYNQDFSGLITAIDSNVSEERFGKVVRVITSLENKDRQLKTGMTGYAKITSDTMPVWKVFSLAIIRFIKVEVWSWIP
ncbi:MAG: efflux RND transporter periplasmic adaptor subunit [Thermodesulfobacteriota bacterium]|nr:efflux RND transporter periplasmic adaptor subunit [Thermodesulfobacteriota bacterium]